MDNKKLLRIRSHIERNKKYIPKIIIMTSIMVILYKTGVLAVEEAAGNEYARNFSNWLIDGVKAVAVAIFAGISIKYLANRKMIQFATFAILSAIIFAFILKPEGIQTIGTKLVNIVFGV